MNMGYLPSNQINDSQVVSPVITFQVNLETVGRQSFLQPNRTYLAGNETVSEADEQKLTRNIWLPGLLHENYEGVGGVHVGANLNSGGQFGGNASPNNGYLQHGDTFTVKGQKALYLKKLYCTGSPNDVLIVVSQS
jgi:hypothetical protein